MEPRKIWQIHGDGGERGTGPIIGYSNTRSNADDRSKGKGWYGGSGYVCEAYCIEVDGKTYALVKPTPIDLDGVQAGKDEQLRRQTIADLTPSSFESLESR